MINQHINFLSALGTKFFPGIGLALARRLLNKFGAEGTVERLKNGAVIDLASVQGISIAKAGTMIAGAKLDAGLLDLALYLDSIGVAKPCATKFHAIWDKKSLKVIKSNPYVLLAVMNWENVDPLGLALGGQYHPCRVVAAIEWCIYLDCEYGKNTCIDQDTLNSMVCDLTACNEVTFRRGLALALRTKSVIEHRGMYQVPAIHWYERLIERYVAYNDRTKLTEEQVDTWLSKSQHSQVTQEQRQAIKNALMYRISAYCGRGGRGKTWTLKAIAEGAKDKNLLDKRRVILSAVAAIAVKRMQHETGFPSEDCRTIAGLLYIERSEHLRDTMIIIDEASMLSLADASRIIRKLPHDTHIVMLGDQNQNPSIQAGRLFYDILINEAVPNVELTSSQRHDQKTDSQLQQILDGHFPELEDYQKGVDSGLFRCLVAHGNRIVDPVQIAEDKAVELYCRFNTNGETTQIISPLRDIRFAGGSDSINRKTHTAIFGPQAAKRFYPGTPVVWTQNMTVEKGTTLSNGSFGFVHENFQPDSEFRLSVAFQFEGIVSLKWFEVDEYLDYAYCITVHKAQGSEWDNVIIVVPYSERMIDRNMIYSALSRCKKRSIIIYHDHDFLSRKVAEPPAHERRRSVLFKEASA